MFDAIWSNTYFPNIEKYFPMVKNANQIYQKRTVP